MIPFVKMAGCGNDFILVEKGHLPENPDLSSMARAICTPGTGLGADGLVVLQPGRFDGLDFSVRIINRSGLPAEMCGNAARCIARHAVTLGLAPPEHSFMTEAGQVRARVGATTVEVDLPDPNPVVLDVSVEIEGTFWKLDVVNVGVPHSVIWWDDIDNAPVGTLGKSLRHAGMFPAGANVNFAAVQGERLRVRTFERGVEAETLACGTGSAASAIAAQSRGFLRSPIEVVTTHGSTLTISFTAENFQARDVVLAGPTAYIAEGRIFDELFKGRESAESV